MKDTINLCLKIAAVALLAVYVALYAQGRDVGRYAYYRDADLEYVLDTSTGVIYQGGYAMNHLTGKEGPVDRQQGHRF